MSAVSNGQFWMYTVILVIFWTLVSATACNNHSKVANKVSLSPSNADDELKNTVNCKSLCEQCGCLGFYCGEECICECNNDHSDTGCIRQIQVNAQNLQIPFEILIQGPTVNQFVRNALKFEQNPDRKLYGYRNKRSTVTVYKPNAGNGNTYQKASCERKLLSKDILDVPKNRNKRSSNHFDWFNDLKNNLIRPAPLTGHKRKQEELKKQPAAPIVTTGSSIFDNSWIFDNTRNILTPKPFNKYKSTKVLSSINNERNEYSMIDIGDSEKYERTNNKFKEHFTDNHKMDTNSSDELRNDEISDNSFLPEQNNRDELLDYLTGELHFGSSFRDDMSKVENDDNLFAEEKEEQTEPKKLQETANGGLDSLIFSDDLTTKHIGSSTDGKEGLHRFRVPLFKPGKFFEKLRKVIES